MVTVHPTAAAPAGQIRSYTCPQCGHQGLFYYTDLALYDNDRDPDANSVVPDDAPAVPGAAIDANSDVVICPNHSCDFVRFRHIAFDLLPRTAIRRRRPDTERPRPENPPVRQL